tara:strand:- start:194 stop:976 length:783 start_codon:yes stop_codon:yes gene_type:complete
VAIISGITGGLTGGLISGLAGTTAATLLAKARALQEPVALWVASESPGTVNTDGTGSEATPTQLVGRIPDISGNGNYAVAGTIATPDNSARATLTEDGDFIGWDFNGTDDYYSLLSPYTITESMTLMSAFGRAGTGLRSVPIGSVSDVVHGGYWWTNDTQYVALGATQTAGPLSTDTGSFVWTASRNATGQILRRNGTEIISRAASTVSGSIDEIGYANDVVEFHDGLIYGVAIFDVELTGAALAAWEAYFASLNGVTLA